MPGPRLCSIDSITPTNNYQVYNCGIFYLGSAKSVLRRPLLAFDVASPPVVGDALVGGEPIVDAYIEAVVSSIIGVGSQAAVCRRITRDDWVYTQATWNIYKTANNWTTGGGDTDVPNVGYTTPSTLGAFTIPGLKDFVTDAIASRSSRVHLRHNLSDESNTGIDRYHSFEAASIRLVVDYSPVGERLLPHAGGRRQDLTVYDHVLQADRQGRVSREIRRLGRTYEDAGRAVLV